MSRALHQKHIVWEILSGICQSNVSITRLRRIERGISKLTYYVECVEAEEPLVVQVWGNRRISVEDGVHNSESTLYEHSIEACLWAYHEMEKYVRVPILRCYGKGGKGFPPFTVCGFIRGRQINDLKNERKAVSRTVGRSLAVLHSRKDVIVFSETPIGGGREECVRMAYKQATRDLNVGGRFSNFLLEKKSCIVRSMEALMRRIVVRNSRTLIHGDLSPDHIIVDKSGNAVFTDIECAKYFDREFDLCRMESDKYRLDKEEFWRGYREISTDEIDAHRMKLYQTVVLVREVCILSQLASCDVKKRDVYRKWGENSISELREIIRDE